MDVSQLFGKAFGDRMIFRASARPLLIGLLNKTLMLSMLSIREPLLFLEYRSQLILLTVRAAHTFKTEMTLYITYHFPLSPKENYDKLSVRCNFLQNENYRIEKGRALKRCTIYLKLVTIPYVGALNASTHLYYMARAGFSSSRELQYVQVRLAWKVPRVQRHSLFL